MKLIDKDKLEAFLNELRENLDDSDFDRGYLCAIDSIFGCYLDTIKVKEVDLDEEIERVRKTHFINDDFEKATLEGRQITNIAKHFFGLGLNVSNPLTDADLDSMQEDYVSLLESRGMKHEEAVIASASYANGVNDVLKRFKAQKGEKV